MSPNTEDEQHWNPPSGGSPEHECQAEDERAHWQEQRGGLGGIREHCASKGRDGNRAHVDPIGGHQVAGGELKEHIAIEDKPDNPEVEHPATKPERHEDEEGCVAVVEHGAVEGAAEDADGLGGDDSHEPTAVDAVGEGGFVAAHGQCGKNCVGAERPKDDAHPPKCVGNGDSAVQECSLAAKYAGGGDTTEEPWRAAVVCPVGDKAVAEED